MKIGINTFGCNHGRSGIGSYILSLVKNLPKRTHEFQLFGHELDKYTYTSDVDHITFQGIDIADTNFSEKLWHLKDLNSFIKKQKYDAVIYPAGISLLPPSFAVPSVPVIQSLLSEDLGTIAKLNLKRILKSTAGIISPSDFIKRDLVRFGISESKIKVIYNGIDTNLFKPISKDDCETVVIQPFSIRKPYIIYASQITNAKKCHIELVEAFSIFKKKYKTAHRLVLAGADGGFSQNVHSAVLRSGFSSDILLTGHFPHESLAKLYASADLCVFPSMVEGVGLAVIEAVACGIPTACAKAGAIPEIVGEPAEYFNPKKTEEVAEIIAGLVNLPENTEKRENAVKKGLEWVKRYNWQKTALQTLDYINLIIGGIV